MPHLPETIVADAEALTACCAHLDACSVIGFDTEFVGEDTYIPDLCLIQVATPNQRYLIDPMVCGPVDEFWKRIIDPKRIVVVHAAREEIRLCHVGIGAPPANLFDIQLAAGFLGMGYPVGYAALIQQVLGKRLSKAETLTDWRKRPLTKEQIRYAFDDVRHLLPIWERFSTQLAKLARLSWLEEETTTLKHRAVVENPVVEKWRKLRGIGSLEPRRLAVAREVFAWREEAAARGNRPTRTVLRDDLIVEIARRDPKKEKDLHSLRGLGRIDFGSLFAAVERGRSLPEDEWPDPIERDNDPPQVASITAILGAVLGDLCIRWSLTPNLVANPQDLRRLVREAGWFRLR